MPVVAAVVVGVAAVASVATKAVAAGKAAKATEQQGEYNAGVLERQAEQMRKVMGFEVGQFDTKAGRYLGGVKTGVQAAGIEMSGSAKQSYNYSTKALATDRRNLVQNYEAKISETLNAAKQTREHGGEMAEAQRWSAWGEGLGGVAQGVMTVGAVGTQSFWG